jgi:hypothetical protein
VRDAPEREHVVHAQRVERDRSGDDQLVVALVVGERGCPERPWGEQLRVGVGDPTRGLLQRFRSGVGAERAQELAYRVLHGRVVD